jgi:hypothetical protein
MTHNPYALDTESLEFLGDVEADTRKPLDHYIEEIAAMDVDSTLVREFNPFPATMGRPEW